MRPNAVGLPGLTAMPWKMTSPVCRDDVEDQVALADRAAAGEHEDVGVGGRVDRRRRARRACRRRSGAAPRRRRARAMTADSVKRLMS